MFLKNNFQIYIKKWHQYSSLKQQQNVPIHFPNIKPPIKATGDPNPKKGKTQRIVNAKKIIEIKNKLEFLSSTK